MNKTGKRRFAESWKEEHKSWSQNNQEAKF